MSTGELTNILVSTNVTRYLDFKQIAGSYVQMGDANKVTIAKVPTREEAWKSSVLSVTQKYNANSFFTWLDKMREDDPSTLVYKVTSFTSKDKEIHADTCTMAEAYDIFGLSETAQDLIGHAMALYQTDDYLDKPGKLRETISRMRLYGTSLERYGKSPYIYPLYGLGELPQGFARLSAIYGGTYMLNTDIDEIHYDGDKVSGISATMKSPGGEGMKFTTKTKKIIADPSYFPGKVQVVGHLLKAICILKHPIDKTNNSDSMQLIIPQKQVGRKHGMFRN